MIRSMSFFEAGGRSVQRIWTVVALAVGVDDMVAVVGAERLLLLMSRRGTSSLLWAAGDGNIVAALQIGVERGEAVPKAFKSGDNKIDLKKGQRLLS